jgi:hypothetical protein
MLLRIATGIVICPFVVILATSIIAMPPYIPYSYYILVIGVSQEKRLRTVLILWGNSQQKYTSGTTAPLCFIQSKNRYYQAEAFIPANSNLYALSFKILA